MYEANTRVVDMLRRLRRWWLTRHWRKCACGHLRVAPHTATEVGGWRHAEDECFRCDAFGGRRAW